MDFEKLAQLSVGLAAAIIVLWIVLVKAKKNRTNGKSGEKSIEYWKMTIQEIVKESLEEGFKGRNEEIRKIIKEELERSKR